MDSFLYAVLNLIKRLLDLYILIIFIEVILSWLIAFNIINPHQTFVRMVRAFTHALTEPLLRPIRSVLYRIIPNLGGIDISPVILVLLVVFVKEAFLPY